MINFPENFHLRRKLLSKSKIINYQNHKITKKQKLTERMRSNEQICECIAYQMFGNRNKMPLLLETLKTQKIERYLGLTRSKLSF
jgi:hypothetical protein